MNFLNPMNPASPISPLNPANSASPLNPVNQQQILNARDPECAFWAIIGTIGVLLLGLVAFTIYTMFKN